MFESFLAVNFVSVLFMSGFTSPNIMFLNTYDSLDRKYMSELAPKLRRAGYNHYVELYAGGFAMPLVMAQSGIRPETMTCYDVSLYSNILGCLFSGRPLEELHVCKDGEPVCLSGKDNVTDAAKLLYEQALARMELVSGIQYYRDLVSDLKVRKTEHVKWIADKLRRMDALLHGLRFETLYVWDALEKEKDKENTFICTNPPTYKGAYEKFFDTGGRITWSGDGIDYKVWDGKVDCKKLMDVAKGIRPLLFLLQQADKGKAATDHPVSCRYLSLTQNVYYNSNRPDEVKSINGLKETTFAGVKLSKSKLLIMPDDYLVNEKSRLAIFVEKSQVAEYYRRIWLHRITGKSVSVNLCVSVDGYIAGFIGLDFNPLIHSYTNTGDFMILSYAVPAPNRCLRMARLLVHVAKSRAILEKALQGANMMQSLMYVSQAMELCTVEYSRYHEVKGLRGLMKLRKKKKLSDNLNALAYYATLNEKSEEEILRDFLDVERRYSDGKKL